MARWKLMTSAYLNCGDTMWEYKELNRDTGRETRKQLPVPRYLDINDPGDWTSKWGNRDNATGEIIVCHKDKGDAHDIAFDGDPTPDMVPLDDEAKAISASFADHWRYKPEGADISYSQSMIDKFEMDKAAAEAKPQQVEIAGLGDLVAAFATMAQQNQDLIKTLAQRKL